MNGGVRSGHDHPMYGPVIIVHSRRDDIGLGDPHNPAHAFGPFATEDEARRFEADFVKHGGQDTCCKMILDLFDPYEQRGL